MPAEETVVEDPVLVLEALQEGVAPDGCVAGLELVVGALALLLESVDAVGEPPGEPEGFALVHGERGACRRGTIGR